MVKIMETSPQLPAGKEDALPAAKEDSVRWLSLPAMRYPNHYVWFIFFSALDIMLTWAILMREGTEVNPLANLVIHEWGLPGAIGFKFSLMLVVILACEVVGRKRDRTARNLMSVAVFVSILPVCYSLSLLTAHIYLAGG